eukprot:6473901-Amphidinium_carterae.1
MAKASVSRPTLFSPMNLTSHREQAAAITPSQCDGRQLEQVDPEQSILSSVFKLVTVHEA